MSDNQKVRDRLLDKIYKEIDVCKNDFLEIPGEQVRLFVLGMLEIFFHIYPEENKIEYQVLKYFYKKYPVRDELLKIAQKIYIAQNDKSSTLSNLNSCINQLEPIIKNQITDLEWKKIQDEIK